MGYRQSASDSKMLNKKWTRSAIDCYELGCVCSNCTLFKVFFSKKRSKCKMKKTVAKLIKLLGMPKVKKNDV